MRRQTNASSLSRTVLRNKLAVILALGSLICFSGILLFISTEVEQHARVQESKTPIPPPRHRAIDVSNPTPRPKPKPEPPQPPHKPPPGEQLPEVENIPAPDPQQFAFVRREAVKAAMAHAWNGYETYAWGQDEVRPVTKQGQDWLGLGATIVDSLDTLWIMGMRDEFARARDWVDQKLDFNIGREVSFFETTIRVLGGLLSAYDLSGDAIFLARAKEIADRLSVAFDSASGIPFTTVELRSGQAHNPAWASGQSILAEAGTVQLEFSFLSRALDDESYARKANRVIDLLAEKNPEKNGLLPVYIDQATGVCTGGPVTLGALGDSYYEYLLKMWIWKGGRKASEAAKFRKLYDQAADSIIEKLVKKSSPSGLTYLADLDRGTLTHKMDHLACFAGAMFALGAASQNSSAEGGPNHRSGEHFRVGAAITETCHEMYARMLSGVAPEFITFNSGSDFAAGAPHNLLRPEAVEAFFVLWRLTHDSKYQEWGWQVFQALEKHCKSAAGYSGLTDVRTTKPVKDDSQPSYFLAETLKYLYLLFSPDDLIPLDRYVFNTEAHPLSIPKQ